jgi:hypothetical protein
MENKTTNVVDVGECDGEKHCFGKHLNFGDYFFPCLNLNFCVEFFLTDFFWGF